MSWTPEDVGLELSLWAASHERLWHSKRPLQNLPEAVDLDGGIRDLDRRLKRQLARFIKLGYEPPRVEGNRYPDPDELKLVVQAKLENQERHEAALAARMVKDIRILILICRRITQRHERPLIEVRVEKRLLNWACPICEKPFRVGVRAVLDRDRGLAWHPACAEALQERMASAMLPTLAS